MTSAEIKKAIKFRPAFDHKVGDRVRPLLRKGEHIYANPRRPDKPLAPRQKIVMHCEGTFIVKEIKFVYPPRSIKRDLLLQSLDGTVVGWGNGSRFFVPTKV